MALPSLVLFQVPLLGTGWRVAERLRQQTAELQRRAEEAIRTARAIIEELHGRYSKGTKPIHV